MPENRKDSIKKLTQAAIGTVVSDKMNKTVVVRIDSVTRYPVYKKVVRRSRKVKVHDEKNTEKTGEGVIGRGNKAYAEIGDIVSANVKEATPDSTVKKGEVVKAVIVRTVNRVKR